MPKAAWTPQVGPQLAAIEATWCDELLFGGARGGGKSDYLLGDYLQDVEEFGAAWRGIIFRRSNSELEEILSRSRALYEPLGAEYLKTDRTWTFPNGATLKLRYLERDVDATRYQGHQYTWVGFDELGQWPNDGPYRKLLACLRSAHGVTKLRMRASANPGGAGHQWIKRRFIYHAPMGFKARLDPDTGHKVMFIPSRVTDNKILLQKDPKYIGRLKGVGSPELVRAWLEGDWSVVTGAYFSEFSISQHVVEPFKIPEHWLRFRCFDWGSSKPSACLWCAVSDGELSRYPRGSIVVYKEYYTSSSPNVGLKLTVEEVADGIKSLTNEDITYSVADTSIFAQDGGESMAERFARKGVMFRPADKKRIPGWEQIRRRLKGEDGKPHLFIFGTCSNLIRTLPAIQHDARKPEDIDTDGEDHALDALRYGLMSRPYAVDAPSKQEPIRGVEHITLNELWNLQSKAKKKSKIA